MAIEYSDRLTKLTMIHFKNICCDSHSIRTNYEQSANAMGETLPVLTMTWLSTEKNQRMATLRLADTVLWFSTK